MNDVATARIGNLILFIPLSEMVDIDQKLKRLEKIIRKEQLEIERLQKKLTHPDFLAKAPKQVIMDHRLRLKKAQQNIEQFKEQQEKFMTS